MSKKKVIAIVLAGLALTGTAASIFASRSAKETNLPKVVAAQVKKENLQTTIDVTGKTESRHKKTYFSPVNALVTQVNVKFGEQVTPASQSIVFDLKDLEKNNQKAQLAVKDGILSEEDAVQKANEQVDKVNDAIARIPVLEAEIEDQQEYINEWMRYQAATAPAGQDAQGQEGAGADVETTIALQQAQADLATLQSELATAKATVESSSTSLTDAALEQMRVNTDLKELEAKSVEELIAEGKKGIISEFKGIVSDVKVSEGATVTQGQELFTLAGLDDVCVKVEINKKDLEKIKLGQKADITVAGNTYQGKVDNISKIALTDDKGNTSLAADVKITNVDDKLFLGVDAKVKIQGQEEKNALVLPVEGINISNDGNFVYLLKNGVIKKQMIETGLSTDDKVQVVSGLNEKDEVILDMKEAKEGDRAEAITEEEAKVEEK